MANKIGPLLKEARTSAGFSQEGLAAKLEGVSASDLSKAERGEKELPQAVLKQIAKLTGVTQTSLVNAAKESTYGASSASSAKKSSASSSKKDSSSDKKTSSSSAKKTSSASSAAKKTTSSSSAKKTSSSSSKAEEQYTSEEKKLITLYRKADADTKKSVLRLLKGEGDSADTGDILSALLGSAVELLGKK